MKGRLCTNMCAWCGDVFLNYLGIVQGGWGVGFKDVSSSVLDGDLTSSDSMVVSADEPLCLRSSELQLCHGYEEK